LLNWGTVDSRFYETLDFMKKFFGTAKIINKIKEITSRSYEPRSYETFDFIKKFFGPDNKKPFKMALDFMKTLSLWKFF
jgi:hypothetical protein